MNELYPEPAQQPRQPVKVITERDSACLTSSTITFHNEASKLCTESTPSEFLKTPLQTTITNSAITDTEKELIYPEPACRIASSFIESCGLYLPSHSSIVNSTLSYSNVNFIERSGIHASALRGSVVEGIGLFMRNVILDDVHLRVISRPPGGLLHISLMNGYGIGRDHFGVDRESPIEITHSTVHNIAAGKNSWLVNDKEFVFSGPEAGFCRIVRNYPDLDRVLQEWFDEVTRKSDLYYVYLESISPALISDNEAKIQSAARRAGIPFRYRSFSNPGLEFYSVEDEFRAYAEAALHE